ncbi:unnamed protein product [Urochloa humidicola]
MLRSMSVLLFVGFLVISSWCPAHAEQTKVTKPTAAPWSIGVPGAVTKSLSVKHMGLPNGVIGAESLAFDCREQGPYASVSDGRILKWDGITQEWT